MEIYIDFSVIYAKPPKLPEKFHSMFTLLSVKRIKLSLLTFNLEAFFNASFEIYPCPCVFYFQRDLLPYSVSVLEHDFECDYCTSHNDSRWIRKSKVI